MSKQKTELGGGWWGKNVDDMAREVARLAVACNVRILDPGVIERVLNDDDSVCGTRNPIAFGKLRDALKMHYHVRAQAAGALGEAQTRELIADIVAQLRKRIGDRLGGDAPDRKA
jgi:hypothetical protein